MVANPVVRDGLDAEALTRAFEPRSGFWMPLTWLSLAADAEWHGLEPGAFHRTNLLLHLANALLVLALWTALTRRYWPSALVAGLFALHPLQVEVVAWITERKELLATFFALLAALAYVRHARGGGRRWYAGTAALFALSLMAKATWVTLPCVLLLLDFWPLRRRERPAWLVAEKLPLLGLSLAIGVVTVATQAGDDALVGIQTYPLHERLAHVLVSYARYLVRLAWPSDPSVFHPHAYLAGDGWAVWQIAGAAALLAGATGSAWWARTRRPWWTVGWLWFLGTLVPMIGLVQQGRQGLADRFTYVPGLGVFVAVAWGAAALAGRFPRARPAVVALAVASLLGAAGTTHRHVGHWQDSRALFTQALRADPGNAFAHDMLGVALLEAGERRKAAWHFAEAVRIDPDDGSARFNLAASLAREGRVDEAIAHARVAAELLPDVPEARRLVGLLLAHRDE